MPDTDPCLPSPCGSYSVCRIASGRPVCSCDVGYIGAPPTCRPECVINSECAMHKACIKNKCIDPCPGTCGYQAICRVVSHRPICSCPLDFIGEPYNQCIQESKKHSIYYQSAAAFVSRFCRTSRCNSKQHLRAVAMWSICNVSNIR